MRVLYFVERFWPFIGGVEVMTARVLPPLARRGIEITIVTSQDDLELPERDRIDGVEVRRLPFGDAVRTSNLDAVIEMRQRIGALPRREVQPDLVHMVFTGPGIYFPVTTAHISPAPTLLSFHGSWPLADLERHSLLRQAIGISAWLTACSDSALADLRALGQGIENRSSTILNGLDPSFEPSELRFDPPVLFCAARLVPEKGLDIAIAALALVREQFPTARLRLAGEGPLRPELERQAAVLGVADSTEFLGARSPDEIATLVDSATVVLVPSRLEGFGLIALEGMLGLRPVVAARTGGLPEVLGRAEGCSSNPTTRSSSQTPSRRCSATASAPWILPRPDGSVPS